MASAIPTRRGRQLVAGAKHRGVRTESPERNSPVPRLAAMRCARTMRCRVLLGPKLASGPIDSKRRSAEISPTLQGVAAAVDDRPVVFGGSVSGAGAGA